MNNPFKSIWNRFFPPEHQPLIGEYYRSTVFYHLTCRVTAVSKGYVGFEIMREGKTPFILVHAINDVKSIKSFNQLWQPYTE